MTVNLLTKISDQKLLQGKAKKMILYIDCLVGFMYIYNDRPVGHYKKGHRMPKIVNRDERRSEIARKAIQLLAEKGIDKTTIQEIADAAGIGKGTVYEYFDSKMDIVKQVTVEFMNEFAVLADNSIADDCNQVEMLRILLNYTVDYLDSFETLAYVYMEIFLKNLRGELPDMKKIFDEMFDGIRGMVTDIIMRGQEAGLFRKDLDAYALASFLFASLDGIALHYYYDKSKINPDMASENFFRAIMSGMLTPRGKRAFPDK